MSTLMIIGALIVAAVLSLLTLAVWHERRRENREQAVEGSRRAASLATLGDYSAEVVRYDAKFDQQLTTWRLDIESTPEELRGDLPAKLAVLQHAQELAQNFSEKSGEVARKQAEQLAAQDLAPEVVTIDTLRMIDELVTYLKWLMPENRERVCVGRPFTADSLPALLTDTIQARYQYLCTQAAQNQQAFLDLRALMAACKPNADNRLGSVSLAYPDSWNDWVVRSFTNPTLSDFAGLPGRTAGEVRLLAGQAIRTRNLKDALIVLAYANASGKSTSYNFRNEVGDYLLGQLSTMVSELRAAARVQANDSPAPA